MSAEPRPHSTSPSIRGVGVVVGRHRVEVAGDDQPLGPAELGAGHDVVADPLDRRGAPSARSRCSTWSASAASSWLSDGMATRSAVRASRSVTVARLRAGRRPPGRITPAVLRCRPIARPIPWAWRRERLDGTSPAGAWGVGLATLHPDGRVLDTWYPSPALASADERRPRRGAGRGSTVPGTCALDAGGRRRAAWASTSAPACGPTTVRRRRACGRSPRSSRASTTRPSTPTTSTCGSTCCPTAGGPPRGQPRRHVRPAEQRRLDAPPGPARSRTSSARGWRCGPPGGRCRCSGSTSSPA